MASMTTIAPMELAMRYGALMAENAMLLERIQKMQAKDEARRQRQREAAYRRRISAVAALSPLNPEAESESEEVAEPIQELPASPVAQTPAFSTLQYTVVSVDEEARITSEIDAGTLKSPTRSVFWHEGVKHHPSSTHPQLVIRYMRANPQLQLNAIADGIGLSYQKTKEMVRELKKQGIVTTA